MTPTIEAIRWWFSRPSRPLERDTGYCVGGAVCYVSGMDTTGFDDLFPQADEIEEGLRRLGAREVNSENILLSGRGILITEYNDLGEYESAWKVAQEAFE